MAHPARSSKVRLEPRLSPLTNPATRCPGARQLYDQPSVVAATAFLKRWYFWATPRRLAPIIDAARTISATGTASCAGSTPKSPTVCLRASTARPSRKSHSPRLPNHPKPHRHRLSSRRQTRSRLAGFKTAKNPFLFLLRWYRNAGNFHIDGAQVVAAGEI